MPDKAIMPKAPSIGIAAEDLRTEPEASKKPPKLKKPKPTEPEVIPANVALRALADALRADTS